ncbi:unnamed protein product [Closterium sp. Naga37s-1]|nr:unnamed protein product [Closterium sp. Naga37s-1]
MEPRVALTVLHWNHTVDRVVKEWRIRVRKATRVRREKNDRVLGAMDWSWVDAVMDRWSKIREGEDGVEGDCGDEEVEAELNMEEEEEVVEEDDEVVLEEETVLEEEEEGVEEEEVVEEEEEVVALEEDGVSNQVVREEVEEEDEGLGVAVEGGREEGQIADDLRSKPARVGVRGVEVELLGRERASGARSTGVVHILDRDVGEGGASYFDGGRSPIDSTSSGRGGEFCLLGT